MASRPKRGDTEDDLLDFQQQFLASRDSPSATIHVMRGSRKEQQGRSEVQRDVVELHGLPQTLESSQTNIGPPRKKSKFKEKRMAKNNEKMNVTSENNESTAEPVDIHDRHISTILTEIKERDIKRSQISMPTGVLHKGFPEVLHRGSITEKENNANQSKKSLFAQHFLTCNSKEFGLPQTNQQSPAPSAKTAVNSGIKYSVDEPFCSPSLVSGEGLITSSHQVASNEVERIHQENVDRLSAMSQDSIKLEQEKLINSLDPSLLAFLKSKQKPSKTENIEQKMETEEMPSTLPTAKAHSNPSQGKTLANESMEFEPTNSNQIKHVSFKENVECITTQEDDKVSEVEELKQLAASQRWVHMDNVETEKLEWMKNCPSPSALNKESGYQARFDFDGSLITRDADIPVNAGLHHHGDDPANAGYTLEELFVLSRSSLLQQRVIAMQTLGRIIVQDTKGSFVNHLQCSVLSSLLDAGILFLLRWALDDTADAVIAVAVQCLAAVLVVPSDQEYCDRVCEWHHGYELPSLKPENSQTSDDEEDEPKRDSDAEMVKKDVIKGLLQMSLLPRLRYVFEVCQPTPTAVRGVFAVLTRIARHSSEACHEITKCPRLLESIFTKFLPSSWKRVGTLLKDVDNIYGLPSPEALRLLRVLCSGGRNLAAILINKYGLINKLLCYTTLHPQDVQLSFTDAMQICIESLRVWTVCIGYGLACDQFRETFPTFLQHIQKLQNLSIVKHDESTPLECQRACAMIKLFEQVIHVAGTSAELHAKMLSSSPDNNRKPEADCLPPPPVNWSHVVGFIPVVLFTLNKWKTEIVGITQEASPNVLDNHVYHVASVCNLLASFYSKLPAQLSFSPVDCLQDIEHLVSTILIPLIGSPFITHLIKSLSKRCSSVLVSRGIKNLPDYGTLPINCNPRMADEPLQHGAALSLMTSLTRLICSIINVHKGIADKFLPLIKRQELTDYLTQITTTQEVQSNCYFGRYDLIMQYFIVKMFYLVGRSVEYQGLSSLLPVYHVSALVVFSRLRTGDEYYSHDLMSTILFNQVFYPEVNDQETSTVTRGLSVLNITTQGPSTSQLLTKEQRSYNQRDLLCEAHKNLLAIRSTYLGSFGKIRNALAVSRSLALHQPHDIQSLMLSPSHGPFLPADWMFVPIVDLHNQTINNEVKGGSVEEVSPTMISTVTCTLQMILMLEEWRPVFLSGVAMVVKITRLMCIFLTGSDMFLDRLVHHYVRSLLIIYTQPQYLSQLDFSGNVAGLSSFYDLYISLLNQYSAVSFGDPLFASFLVLPLAQRHHVKYRHALWDEYISTIRAVSFPVNQVPIPLDHFLYPIEQDNVLLYLYLRALANQEARPRWCPFFYLIAVHHINAFIYQRIDPKDSLLLQRKMSLLHHVMEVKIQDVRDDILYYYKPLPDSNSSKAFEVFSSLPPDREILLRNRQNFEECCKLYEEMTT